MKNLSNKSHYSDTKSKKIVIIIFIIVMSFFLYKNLERYLYLNYFDTGLTIGKTTEYSHRGRYINYKYYVRNKLYLAAAKRDYDGYKLNKFYYVKFSKNKPDISQIQFDSEIKDSLKIHKEYINPDG